MISPISNCNLTLDVAFVLIDCFAKTGHCYPVWVAGCYSWSYSNYPSLLVPLIVWHSYSLTKKERQHFCNVFIRISTDLITRSFFKYFLTYTARFEIDDKPCNNNSTDKYKSYNKPMCVILHNLKLNRNYQTKYVIMTLITDNTFYLF